VHPFDDSDITWQKLDEWYTANLVNGLGNVVARVMKMSETHLEPTSFSLPEPSDFSGTVDFDMQKSLDHVWHQIQKLDEMITLTEPFKLIKTDDAKAKQIISSLRESIFKVAIQLKPFLPNTADVIAVAVQQNKKPDNLFVRLES
jgi:methionyl-tRNA synthetase